MNKSDLVRYVSDKTLITKSDADIIINVFLKGIRDILKSGEKVNIKNLGVFFIQNKKARNAINPRTGEIVSVPEKKVIKFKSSKNIIK